MSKFEYYLGYVTTALKNQKQFFLRISDLKKTLIREILLHLLVIKIAELVSLYFTKRSREWNYTTTTIIKQQCEGGRRARPWADRTKQTAIIKLLGPGRPSWVQKRERRSDAAGRAKALGFSAKGWLRRGCRLSQGGCHVQIILQIYISLKR